MGMKEWNNVFNLAQFNECLWCAMRGARRRG